MKKKFPVRSKSHVMETRSWKIFEQAVPDEWIIREVSERDYGIDAYIELVHRGGEVTGELCSIQLKSSKSLAWSIKKGETIPTTTLRAIKISTVNYWMHLPIPVFIVLSDNSSGKAYYLPVKNYVRKNYNDFVNSEGKVKFVLRQNQELGNPNEFPFVVNYLFERHFDNFVEEIRTLLFHCEEYFEFILCNQGRDCFLEVDNDQEYKMEHIYRMLHSLAFHLGVKWNVVKLKEAYAEDKKTWNHNWNLIHERTMDIIMRDLEPVFIEVINKLKKKLTGKEAPFWEHQYFQIYRKADALDTDKFSKERFW